MIDCILTLSGGALGGTITAEGRLSRSGAGFVLEYALDGDGCTLTYDGCTLTQERRGSTQIKIEFAAGRQTQCVLGAGGYSGAAPVFCRRLDVAREGEGVRAFLAYELGGEDMQMQICAVPVKGQ